MIPPAWGDERRAGSGTQVATVFRGVDVAPVTGRGSARRGVAPA